ncbi:two pore domain potassium channel [Dermatophagoides farinae]|uniref:Two pore domain potassium channel n=1 Tax=Dermatophagoides farinae TaxID=6954 RepID=A0A922HSN3_DERFA|nr:two pore domain potassium channel [Dermatophagoides farinae]
MDFERKKCIFDLWNYTITNNIVYPDRWKRMAFERIMRLEETIIKAVQKDGYSIIDVEQWSFSSALLYSVTVITTIGYGNLTCKTDLGRIVTIFYAIIGIPITFLCLANLGNLMANAFRFMYKHFCCSDCRHGSIKSRSQIQRKQQLPQQMKTTMFINGHQKNEIITTTTTINNHDDDDDKIQSIYPKKKEHRVPICLVIMVVIGYIIIGTIMFYLWEDWSPIEGAYFCFTTLTTIGFGDLVPGSARYSPINGGATRFIICCMYMMIGLSLLAMSFNLVQEEILIKCRCIAKNLGIIPVDDDVKKTKSLILIEILLND